jgi:hypothetical protein
MDTRSSPVAPSAAPSDAIASARTSPGPDSRIQSALRHLVEQGTLTPGQADAVRRELDLPPAGAHAAPGDDARSGIAWTSILAEVGGYVGAAFVLASAVVLSGPRWQDLSTAAQVAGLALPALAMLLAAFVIARATPGGWTVRERRGTGRRRRLVSALAVVAAGLGAGAAAVAASSSWEGLTAALTALVVTGCAYLACRTPVLHAAAAVSAAVVGPTLLAHLGADSDTGGGTGLVVVGVVWAALTLFRRLDETALGLAAAGVMTFVGGETLASDGVRPLVGFVVLGLLAVAGLVGYVATRHVVVLVVGVGSLAVVVPQAVLHYTEGALGAGGALLVTGLSIVGASVLGLRLRREVPDD